MPQEWFRQIGGLEIKWHKSVFVYADDKIMGESVHTVEKNTGTNSHWEGHWSRSAEKNWYVVMSRD